MNIRHSVTGQTVPIRVDFVSVQPEGCILVEAMYSGITDLSAPSANLAARLHPNKGRAFEWIVTGHCRSAVPRPGQEGFENLKPGQSIQIIPDVEIYVPGPQGEVVVRHFSEFSGCHRKLAESGICDDVRRTISLPGFEAHAEPIVREMHDGSLFLIFGFMPPLVIESDPAKAERFEPNDFAAQLQKAAGAAMIWDDREIVIIQQPARDTVEGIGQFLLQYWGDGGRPWWKMW